MSSVRHYEYGVPLGFIINGGVKINGGKGFKDFKKLINGGVKISGGGGGGRADKI